MFDYCSIKYTQRSQVRCLWTRDYLTQGLDTELYSPNPGFLFVYRAIYKSPSIKIKFFGLVNYPYGAGLDFLFRSSTINLYFSYKLKKNK